MDNIDKEKIYEEEKARLEARQKLKKEQENKKTGIGCLGIILVVAIIYFFTSCDSSKQSPPQPSSAAQTSQNQANSDPTEKKFELKLGGTTAIGTPISEFMKIYGESSKVGGMAYEYQNKKLQIFPDSPDNKSEYVNSVHINLIKNLKISSGQSESNYKSEYPYQSLKSIEPIILAFLPNDARLIGQRIYKDKNTPYWKICRLYESNWLATNFDKSKRNPINVDEDTNFKAISVVINKVEEGYQQIIVATGNYEWDNFQPSSDSWNEINTID